MSNKILAYIPTRDRYDILFMAMQSIALQTVKPNKFILFDDGERKDLREIDIYKHMFKLFDANGIEWEVIFGEGKGQHRLHQRANMMGDEFDLLWRVDDDENASPDVLEKLLSHIAEDVGAVGGSVIVPGAEMDGGTNRIEDIFHTTNLQWARGTGTYEVDHLYSSFLYRPGIVDYNLNLSPVAHREETLFTFGLKKAGYRILVDRSAMTYHYKKSSGGIRSHDNSWFYQHDDRIFMKKLEEWGYKFASLNCGLGDTISFAHHVLPKLIKKYSRVIVGNCYPEVFEDFPVKSIPVGAIQNVLPDENIYKWCIDHNWKTSTADAYCSMYGVEL